MMMMMMILVKVNLSPSMSVKAYRGNEGVAPFILKLGFRWR